MDPFQSPEVMKILRALSNYEDPLELPEGILQLAALLGPGSEDISSQLAGNVLAEPDGASVMSISDAVKLASSRYKALKGGDEMDVGKLFWLAGCCFR